MNSTLRRSALAAIAACVLAAPGPLVTGAFAQEPTHSRLPAGLDSFIARVQDVFDVPGIAVGVVQNSETLIAKGYGVRRIEFEDPVTEHTLFGIASNTKAFTTTAIAILVDEGRLDWNDRVIDYIPQFRMADPYVTREFMVRDLVTHRSGLGLGAGDLMAWPRTDFTRSEIIERIRYLTPVSSFRSKYDYDNLLYMVAGEIIPALTGQSWETFVRDRIFAPLEMTSSLTGVDELTSDSNVVTPHIPVEEKLQPYYFAKGQNLAAAGGVISCVVDLIPWVNTHLYDGLILGTETHLISAKQAKELRTPQTILPHSDRDGWNSNFVLYGLGFVLQDYSGRMIVSHTGGLPGMVSKITMVPSEKLGIIVLTNQQSGYAFRAITNYILDAMLGVTGNDWLTFFEGKRAESKERARKAIAKARDERAKGTKPSHELSAYAGTYRDAWRGDVWIEFTNKKLEMRFSRTEGLVGILEHWHYDTFVVHWEDRTLDADCFVTFAFGHDGEITHATMKPVSPLTDFSYDFQDLRLERVRN
jgi:CubicO group peptidase (beta-lactamase class C family)